MIIALLSSLGGVMSAFVGYLASLINIAVGVPFGAGQLITGLHVFWLVLILGITKKSGTATIGGLLKGAVELFAGSSHGIVIVLVSLIEGIVLDFVLLADKEKSSYFMFYIGAALSSMANVFVFQAIYMNNVPLAYIMVMASLAFASGTIFGGYFGRSTIDLLVESNVIAGEPTFRKVVQRHHLPVLVFLIVIVAGAGFYYTAIYKPFADPLSFQVTGNVEHPYTYHHADFVSQYVTIEAEMIGSTTYVPPKNYTGTPLSIVLQHAGLKSTNGTVIVRASDGYEKSFSLANVLNDTKIIVSEYEGHLRIVAANYDAAYWIRNIVEIIVS